MHRLNPRGYYRAITIVLNAHVSRASKDRLVIMWAVYSLNRFHIATELFLLQATFYLQCVHC